MNRTPRLPQPCAWIGSRLPAGLPNRLLAWLLNRILEAARRDGELDWLRDKVVCLVFEDAGVCLHIATDARGHLHVRSRGSSPDVTIEGLVYDFFLLATRREDPDTLFFQRRLRLSGDVELGLHLKNFLDSLESGPTQRHVLGVLRRTQDMIVQRVRPRSGSS